MPSLLLISQHLWAYDDCTELAGVTRYNFSCSWCYTIQFFLQLVSQRWKRNPLQDAEDMLHVATLEPQLAIVSRKSMETLQKVKSSSTLCSCCKPKKLRDELLKWLITRSNLPSTCLATPLQHKLQRNLHRVILAV